MAWEWLRNIGYKKYDSIDWFTWLWKLKVKWSSSLSCNVIPIISRIVISCTCRTGVHVIALVCDIIFTVTIYKCIQVCWTKIIPCVVFFYSKIDLLPIFFKLKVSAWTKVLAKPQESIASVKIRNFFCITGFVTIFNLLDIWNESIGIWCTYNKFQENYKYEIK